jgi:lysozyme family protein
MMRNFAEALKHTLIEEGGFSDHPADPGGATMKGITLNTYREYKRNTHLTPEDLKAIPQDEVEEIYKKRYWNACQCDVLPAGLDVCVFDTAVNSGPGRAAKFLQECLGVTPDGAIGAGTIAALGKADPKLLVLDYINKRQSYLESLKTFPIFGKGWTARVSRLKDLALKIA